MAENDCLSTRLRSAVVQFYKDCFGRGPVQVRVTLGDGVAVCLLSGAMTVAERTVLAGPDAGRARDRVKRWHREVLEANRDRLAAAVEGVLAGRVRSLHHDLSTAADECALVLCVDAPAGQSDTKI